ncbi:MAG: prepilin-type N-terminal cleavage/methylation domain-containing protein [Mariprofundaceae bacterium]|nr:prepilin-type N-terminal cleavage/methylation domain-containing protein [Mariprofundaceae bacterium]
MKKVQINRGFTLMELLISLVIGMVILAGMSSVFIAQTRTSTMLSDKTAGMGDVYLASQIMQSELRGSKAICWNVAASRLVYQPFDSPTALTTACLAPTVANTATANGSFELRPVSVTKPTPYICWNRPNDATKCQELLRNMLAVTGLAVTPVVNANMLVMRTIVLTSQYRGQDGSAKPLSLEFKIWPRNL